MPVHCPGGKSPCCTLSRRSRLPRYNDVAVRRARSPRPARKVFLPTMMLILGSVRSFVGTDTHCRSRLTARALLILLVAAANPAGISAQTIAGQVYEHPPDRPLAGVHVQLVQSDGSPVATTTSDANGRFTITAPAAGAWRISAEHVGFETVRSEEFRLAVGQEATVVVRMTVDPIPIEDPIVVVGESSNLHPDIQRFHERRRRGERLGIGYFLYGEDLERRGGARASDLVRMIPGVTVTSLPGRHDQVIRMRRGCIPAVYVDGSRINETARSESLDAHVNLTSIESVEVYRGTQQPGGTYFDQNGCGLVLIWTKRVASDAGPAISWRRLAAAAGVIVLLFVVR